MKLHLNIISLKCGKEFYDIFKKLTDEEARELKWGWLYLTVVVSCNQISKLSTKSDSNSNIITRNFTKELEFSGLDNKRLCFEFQHRKKIIAQISESISNLHKILLQLSDHVWCKMIEGTLCSCISFLTTEEKANKYNFFGN